MPVHARNLCQSDLCQDPKKIQDSGSAGSKIWDPGGSWIQQLRFCQGIQGILDPALQILREILSVLDLGSSTADFARDPMDCGSSTSDFARDPMDLGSYFFNFSRDLFGFY